MQIVVLADELQKEILLKTIVADSAIIWIDRVDDFLNYIEADACIDLQFINKNDRVSLLKQLAPRLVFINAVSDRLKETDSSFIRINGWNTFLSASIFEAACNNESNKQKATEVFSYFNKQLEWCSDDIGFITARVIGMIINEAYLALEEEVSLKEEIDTAMKLGTAYPYGPFEWAEKIGIQNVASLLQKLSQTQSRYAPAKLLLQEARFLHKV